MMRGRALIAITLALAGMAAFPAGAQEPAETPAASTAPAADANVIIYRRHAEPLLFVPTLTIDGRKVAALAQREYTEVRVAPGEHELVLTWPLLSAQDRGKTTLTIQDDGKIHYLEIVGVSRVVGATIYATLVKTGSGIGERPAEVGASEVAQCCRFKAPL